MSDVVYDQHMLAKQAGGGSGSARHVSPELHVGHGRAMKTALEGKLYGYYNSIEQEPREEVGLAVGGFPRVLPQLRDN